MTGIILQARLDSSRLPRKALLDVAGEPLIVHAMRSLSLVPADIRVLAMDAASEIHLTPLAESNGFSPFVGPKEDVLGRFCLAIGQYGISTVIRATGDNPLVSYELAASLVEEALHEKSDYAGYLGMPVGMGVEVVRAEALVIASKETDDPYCHEHVSPFLYQNPHRFRIFRPEVPLQYRFPQGRVTVDTQDDYERVVRIFKRVYNGTPPSALSVIEHLKREAASR